MLQLEANFPNFIPCYYPIKSVLCVVFHTFTYLIFVAVKSCNVLFLEEAGIQNDKHHKNLNQGSLAKQSIGFDI